MTDRLYGTLAEVLDDLELGGLKSESKLLGFIVAASRVIDNRVGYFIPRTETRRYMGNGQRDLWIDPVLAITAATLQEGETVLTLTSADYRLFPANRWWENGPYTRLAVDKDSTQIGAWTSGEQDNIALTGRWGLYEESRGTGAAISGGTQTAGATSLAVDNGAPFSPGLVALIESEQELIEETSAASDSTANLAEAVDISEEEIDVDNAALVNVGEIIRVDTERMKVLDKAGNTLVVVRGWAGTKIATHANLADVFVYRTFTVRRGVNGTTAASHVNATAISRYHAPRDINYWCRQIAGLMHKKAQGGWAGKVGNPELGEVFYIKEFPSDPLKEIAANYRWVS